MQIQVRSKLVSEGRDFHIAFAYTVINPEIYTEMCLVGRLVPLPCSLETLVVTVTAFKSDNFSPFFSLFFWIDRPEYNFFK